MIEIKPDTPEEIAEQIAWSKETLESPYACCNAREMALEILIEYEPQNKEHWLNIRQICRGNGSDYQLFNDE